MRPHLLQLFNTKTLHPFPTVPNITGENVTSQDMSVSRKRGRPKSSETEKLVTKVRKAEKEKMRRTARKEAQTIDQSQSSKKKKRGRPKLSEEDKLKNKENKLEREKLRRNAKKIPEKSQFSEGENENEGKKRGRPKLSEEQKLLNKAKKAERDRVRRSAKREKMYSNDRRYTMKLKVLSIISVHIATHYRYFFGRKKIDSNGVVNKELLKYTYPSWMLHFIQRKKRPATVPHLHAVLAVFTEREPTFIALQLFITKYSL